MINRVVRDCKHSGEVTQCLHRIKLLNDGWMRYECTVCGAVSFSKPFNKVREDTKLILGKAPKTNYLKKS